jgi:hypothetical protein
MNEQCGESGIIFATKEGKSRCPVCLLFRTVTVIVPYREVISAKSVLMLKDRWHFSPIMTVTVAVEAS